MSKETTRAAQQLFSISDPQRKEITAVINGEQVKLRFTIGVFRLLCLKHNTTFAKMSELISENPVQFISDAMECAGKIAKNEHAVNGAQDFVDNLTFEEFQELTSVVVGAISGNLEGVSVKDSGEEAPKEVLPEANPLHKQETA